MSDNPLYPQNPLNAQKILVVDDEEGIRYGCDRVLRSQGYQVLQSENGEKGLEILRRETDIDLVLVDLRMPGMSGLDFLQLAQEIAPETVYVMITAYATLEAAVEATKRGAYDFIAKPFAPDDILRTVTRALERARLIRERNRFDAERRQRMLELAKEKTQFRAVIDCMVDGVMVCNAEQVLVLYNPAALKILCHLQSLRTQVALSEVLESEDLIHLISYASTHRKRVSSEIRLSFKPKETWLLANVAPVVDWASGQFLGTVTVLRDITDPKHMEHVKAEFVGMVAHELRAPLTAVDAYLSVLEEGYVQNKEKQDAIIKRSKQRLAALMELVDDLLKVTSMGEGVLRREITLQRIEEILKEVLQLMQPLADRNSVRLEVQAPAYLCDVHGDREELTRLFGNLVNNAVKYNKKDGSVSIAVEQEGPYVKVAIADTGIGMTKDTLTRLFSEFFREKRKETKGIAGTGLGLHIVKNIVDFYNGRIEVKSELDKGSTFTVWLPCQTDQTP